MGRPSQKSIVNDPISPFFHEVWAIQRQIYRYPFAVKLDQMAKHPAIIGYAQKLALHYFRQSKKKAPTAFDLITQCYLLALLFYPLQERLLQRVYKPSWSSQVLCSWMRKAVSKQTRQYFFSQTVISDEWKDNSLLLTTLNQTDISWLTFNIDLLNFESRRDTLAGKLSKMIIEPFLYAGYDDLSNNEYGVAETLQCRKMRRKKKLPTASSIRIGNKVYLFGDKNCSNGGGWSDLRIGRENISYFMINYQKNKYGEGLNINICDEKIQELKNEIKLIISSKGEVIYKYFLICRKIDFFANIVCCATGSGDQLYELDKWISDKINKKIFPSLSEVRRKSIFHIKTDLKKIIKRDLVNNVNFYNFNKIGTKHHTAMFSPYRL